MSTTIISAIVAKNNGGNGQTVQLVNLTICPIRDNELLDNCGSYGAPAPQLIWNSP